MPKASRKVPLVAAISVMRSSPRAVSTSATIGTFGSRLAVSVTWSTDSTIASMTPPTEVSDNMLEVVGPPLGAEAVDADPVGVARAEPPGHVVARGGLVLGRDGILDVEDDDVGAGVGGRREPVVLRAVDQQPASGEYRVDARAGFAGVRFVGAGLVVHAFMVAYRATVRQNGLRIGISRAWRRRSVSIAFQCRSAAVGIVDGAVVRRPRIRGPRHTTRWCARRRPRSAPCPASRPLRG